MSSELFKNVSLQNGFTNHLYLIYMYKVDLALNNLQGLICHKTQPNQTNQPAPQKSYMETLVENHFFFFFFTGKLLIPLLMIVKIWQSVGFLLWWQK